MRAILFFALFISLYSCRNKENDEAGAAGKTAADSVRQDTLPYYDVPTTIRSELSAVLHGRYLIYEMTETNGKQDSVLIDTARMAQYAAPFYSVNLNQPEIKKQYKESVFEDRDTKSFVLNYITTSQSLPVKSLSVMLDNSTQEFKRMDMMRSYRQNDTSYEERLGWTAGKRFQVVRIATAGNTELTKKFWVIWHPKK